MKSTTDCLHVEFGQVLASAALSGARRGLSLREAAMDTLRSSLREYERSGIVPFRLERRILKANTR